MKRKLVGMATLAIALAWLTLAACQKGPQKPHVAITISKETTYITEPLRKDGYIDYVAALNQRFRAGVTPQNNAAVPFLMAMGPGEIDAKLRDEYCRMLGISPLPENGGHRVKLDEYVQRFQGAANPAAKAGKLNRDIIIEQEAQAEMRPWSAKEFPILAGWLAANERYLALLVAASKRPRRYDPLISGDCGVIGILLPAAQRYREAVLVLTARAMLRVGEGKVDEAWDDLLACHRLARLVGQGPTLVEALVAVVLDAIACARDQALLQHTRLTPAQIARMRADLDKLPPMPMMVDKVNVAERFCFLDCVRLVAQRGGLDSLDDPTEIGKPESMFKSLIDWNVRTAVDWNQVLRMDNSWCDRLADAYGKPAGARARRRCERSITTLASYTRRPETGNSRGLSMLFRSRTTITEQVGQVFLSLFLPGTTACRRRGSRNDDVRPDQARLCPRRVSRRPRRVPGEAGGPDAQVRRGSPQGHF